MAFPDIFKLEKLTIEAFSDRARQTPLNLKFEAMFNPSTITQTYAIGYRRERKINKEVQEAHFERVNPASLKLELLLDGTGVDQIGVLTLFGSNQTVAEKIDTFLQVCYALDGEKHAPNHLKITWGKFNHSLGQDGFRGCLKSVAITYESFGRDGDPMRAKLDVEIIGDDDPDRQKAALALSSPDLTHSRLVRNGDTLPLLTADVYGSSRHVPEIARANDLDQFRTITPGRQLVFPPIAG